MTPIHFIDPAATVPDSTRRAVWHFAVIMADVSIGEDCSVGSRAEIGRDSHIGDRSRISSGVFLPYHSQIGADVFIGPNTTFTDDRYPRILKAGEHYRAEPPVVEDHASIGAGCVILPGVRIGHHALIGAGSVVAHDVAPFMVLRGEPARIISERLTPQSNVDHFLAGR